ncbi:hypothetical protein [Streptomyces tsukubensis]|uniref:hypothetical protein n=1 Tax=Streptomyces tsukubensis TaxID=83656 RepID=UPI00344C7A14
MQYHESHELRCVYITGDVSVTAFDDEADAQAAYEKEMRTIAKGEEVSLVRITEVTIAQANRPA